MIRSLATRCRCSINCLNVIKVTSLKIIYFNDELDLYIDRLIDRIFFLIQQNTVCIVTLYLVFQIKYSSHFTLIFHSKDLPLNWCDHWIQTFSVGLAAINEPFNFWSQLPFDLCILPGGILHLRHCWGHKNALMPFLAARQIFSLPSLLPMSHVSLSLSLVPFNIPTRLLSPSAFLTTPSPSPAAGPINVSDCQFVSRPYIIWCGASQAIIEKAFWSWNGRSQPAGVTVTVSAIGDTNAPIQLYYYIKWIFLDITDLVSAATISLRQLYRQWK